MSGDDGYLLISIGQSRDDACLDVVFVHGITGDALITWGALQPDFSSTTGKIQSVTKAPDPKNSPTFWPRWILDDVNEALRDSQTEAGHTAGAWINVWSLGYPAPLWGLKDPYAYPESLRQAIRPSLSQLKENGIGRRAGSGVVFITHSLGGLATKAILAECDQQPDHRKLLESTRGVAFLATPHSGAALSNLFGCLPAMIGAVGTSTKSITWVAGQPLVGTVVNAATTFAKWFAEPANQIQWLQKADPSLRLLAEFYRKVAVQRRIATRAFYETQPFRGLRPKLIAWVVDASNADPGVPDCHPVPVPGGDHVTMCKPDSRASAMYVSLRDWVAELAIQQRRGKGVPVLHEELPALLGRIHSGYTTCAAIKAVPKRLQDIPTDGQLRVNFSKAFRDVASDALEKDMGALLRGNGDLIEALAGSDWDLDQMVLFLWLGLQLKKDLERVSTVLQKQARLLEAEGGPPPTLILTYRSVDALREGLTGGLRSLLPEFNTIRERIDARRDCDSRGRTRLLLEDGFRLLQPALQWSKPPK